VARWQDRASQKEALVQAGVPTSPFTVIDGEATARAFFARHKRIVFKKRQGGYDGYGTFMARTPRELETRLAELKLADGSFIAEAFVPFKRELAISFARNPRGQLAALPLVQTHQVDHRLDWLKGPVRHLGLTKLRARIAKLLSGEEFVGAIAFELFDTGRELLVNEVAPRVHNSAHYSLEALDTDQFTLHLKAVLDDELADPVVLGKGFALVNLIGAGASTPAAPRKRQGHLHWYGKTESRKGRKMGHLTWVGGDVEQGLKLLLRERKGFQL
jgi:5-(carboxyamino)imidazole ribonucleotide synthase